MGAELYPTTLEGKDHSQVSFDTQNYFMTSNHLLRVTASYMGKEDKKSVVQKVFLVVQANQWPFLQVWGLLYTNTMVRVELGSGLDQRSRQAILAYIGSGHRSDVQTPTTNLRYGLLLPCVLIFPRVSVLPSEMRGVEDLVLHSPFLVTIVVSR